MYVWRNCTHAYNFNAYSVLRKCVPIFRKWMSSNMFLYIFSFYYEWSGLTLRLRYLILSWLNFWSKWHIVSCTFDLSSDILQPSCHSTNKVHFVLQVYKFKTEKFISPDMLNAAKIVLHLRTTVQQLMKRCENIAKDMQYILSNIVNGLEDAGISKQPDLLNPS